MSIIVSKPEFNLRDKLNELDYGRVPYEKMPTGSVIQVVDHKANDHPTTNSNSYTTIAGTTFSITPRFKTSKIFVSWDFGTEHNGVINGLAFRTYRQVSGLNADGSDTLLRTQDQFSYPTQTGWGAGAGGVNITFVDYPGTILQCTYYLQWSIESSGTMYINYNDGSNKHGITAQAMEIRQ